jgi:hypothetical protein
LLYKRRFFTLQKIFYPNDEKITIDRKDKRRIRILLGNNEKMEKFPFSKNWQEFIEKYLSKERIEQAKKSLLEF